MSACAKRPGRLANVALAMGPALGLAALLAGCGPAAGRIESRTFYSPKGYTVTLPEKGWRVEPGGGDLELRRDLPAAGMLADATCEGPDPGRPLPVLARHLVFGLTRPVTVESDTRMVGGRPAAHRVLRGVVDGRQVEVEALVVKGDRCVHDFLYVAPAGQFEAGRRDFQIFVESFSPGAGE
jgi:hypothetical protein